MRRYTIVLNENRSIQFTDRWIHELRNKPREIIRKLLSFLGFSAIAIYLFALPFWATSVSDVESMYSVYLIQLVVILVFIFFGLTLLTKWQYLIDPPMFVYVLFFALFSISAYLFAESAAANTFGVRGVRYMAGIIVMAFVAIFYFINVFADTKERVSRFEKVVLLVPVLGLALTVLYPEQNLRMDNLLALSFVSMGMYYIWARNRWLKYLAVVSKIGVLWILLNTNSNWGWYLTILAVFFALLWIWVLSIRPSPKEIYSSVAKDIKLLLSRKLSLDKLLRQRFVLSILASIVIWALVMLIWVAANKPDIYRDVEFITSQIERLVSTASAGEILVGRGATAAPRVTTFSTILQYQGVIGVISYIILAFSSIYFVGKEAILDTKKRNRYFALVVLPYIIAVPIFGLFGGVSILEMVLWWSGIAMVAARKLLERRKPVYKVVNKIRVFRWEIKKWLFIPQVVILLLVFLLWVWANSQVLLLESSGLI